MTSRIFIGILTSVAVLFFMGCSQLPQQPINDTKAALEAAKKADAQKYAPAQFQAAVVSYELARKEILEESRKLPFLRKYSKIIETLECAKSAAESALFASETARDLLTRETQGLLAEAQTVVDTVDSSIIRAKAARINTDSISLELDSLNAQIRDAGAVLGTGDLFAAKDMAVLVQKSASAIGDKAATILPGKKGGRKKK